MKFKFKGKTIEAPFEEVSSPSNFRKFIKWKRENGYIEPIENLYMNSISPDCSFSVSTYE